MEATKTSWADEPEDEYVDLEQQAWGEKMTEWTTEVEWDPVKVISGPGPQCSPSFAYHAAWAFIDKFLGIFEDEWDEAWKVVPDRALRGLRRSLLRNAKPWPTAHKVVDGNGRCTWANNVWPAKTVVVDIPTAGMKVTISPIQDEAGKDVSTNIEVRFLHDDTLAYSFPNVSRAAAIRATWAALRIREV